MDLCGKVAVMTGRKGIGRVVAQELAQRGMNLVLSMTGHGPRRQPAFSVFVRSRRYSAVFSERIAA